jgi:hypothetical protein
VQPVDESVRLVELVTQAGHPAPGNHGSVTLHPPRADFGRFHLLGDFLDVHVQRLEQLPRLRGVGVIDHVGIFASTTAARAPGTAQQNALPPQQRSLFWQRSRSSLLTFAMKCAKSDVPVMWNVL